MMILADRPEPLGPSSVTGWLHCGDPVPSGPPGYSAAAYPLGSNTYLSIAPGGKVTSAATIGGNELFQVVGNILECERNGVLVFCCRTGLV